MEYPSRGRDINKIVSKYTVYKDTIRFFEQHKELYGSYIFYPKIREIKKNELLQSNFPNDLVSFSEDISSCNNCALGSTRNKFVFGVGDPHADIVLVGEAPGKAEDLNGEPFVGRAGRLLDKILAAIQMDRNKRVYICNVIKCRPPQNRDPFPEEIEKCEPYLLHQIKLIKPKIIIALGRVSASTLLKENNSLQSMREKLHDYYGVPLLVTYHPAALLRNPKLKKFAWDDFQFVRDFVKG